MPTDTQPSPADQLADLLDGKLDAADVDPEVAQLADLAASVRTHITLVPPTEAFREALRDQVVQAAGAPAAGTATTASTATSTVAGGGGGFSAIVAGLAATAVLATSTVAVADRAGPGDLLAGLDRAVERVQLAIADDATDVDLLVGFATERVLEALDVLDTAVVNELLVDAEALIADALDLAAIQGRAVDELVRPYASALITLASRTDDPAVRALVEQRLAEIGVTSGDLEGLESGDADGAVPSGGAASEDGTDDAADDVTQPGDTSDEDLVDEVEDGVGDIVDDVTDPLDEVTDPLDDVTDPLDDVVDDVTGDLEDGTDAVDDATDDLLGD